MSLPEADIKELVKTCGYISTRKDGTEKLNFNDFYVALLTALQQTFFINSLIQWNYSLSYNPLCSLYCRHGNRNRTRLQSN